jgi:hypothetical protein
VTLDTRQSAIAKAELIVVHDAENHELGAVVPPIAQTSLFTFDGYAQMLETFSGKRARNVYSRTTNPTVTLFERKIAALEQADDAIGFPSGMAAISGAILGFVRPQDRIVCVRDVYPDAYRFFETLLKGLQVSVQYVDGADLRAMESALEGARILYLESPTSWTMRALDVRALAQIARRRGAISIIDNSWATPLFQRPITLGVDLVLAGIAIPWRACLRATPSASRTCAARYARTSAQNWPHSRHGCCCAVCAPCPCACWRTKARRCNWRGAWPSIPKSRPCIIQPWLDRCRRA